MLGPTKPRQLSAPIAASLDELDSWDHFYRHLEANLDLSFVREWGAARYATRSRSHNVVLPPCRSMEQVEMVVLRFTADDAAREIAA